MTTEAPELADRIHTVRYLAAAAAACTAILYLLIGFGVVSVGQSTGGATPGLLGFGLMAGGTFFVAAFLLVRFEARVLWSVIALLQIAVIAGYVAAADLRTPAFEPWGLAVKTFQVLGLCAVVYLLLIEGDRAAGGQQHD